MLYANKNRITPTPAARAGGSVSAISGYNQPERTAATFNGHSLRVPDRPAW